MMRKSLIYLFSILFILNFTGCSNTDSSANNKVELTVSIAASLSDVMNEAKIQFEQEKKDTIIRFSVGGSGTLSQQIQQGAPVDLFISAAPDKMDQLEEMGYVLPNSRSELLSNQLVLITQSDFKIDPKLVDKNFHVLTSSAIQHLAIGEPRTVPAGKYAKEVLQHEQLWEALQPKIVTTKDVRQVLTYVETGNVEAGIVYLSDALQNPKVKIVAKADPTWHTPIVYPIAIIRDSHYPKEAQEFIDFLFSQKGQGIIKKYGFMPPKS